VRRGELYLVRKPGGDDPRRQRVFAVVSRQALLDSRLSTAVCAPVYSRFDGLSTQVRIGPEEGLKRVSAIHCDELVSLPKKMLTNYVGKLSGQRTSELNRALERALGLEGERLTGQEIARVTPSL